MNKKSDNNVHLHGFVNEVRINAPEEGNKHFINVTLATYEQYKDSEGETKKKYTFHNISLATENQEIIKQFEDVRDALAKEDNQKTFIASVDGSLVTKEYEKEGVKYYNTSVVTNENDFKHGAKRQENEVMNAANIKGNIASIDMQDGFARINIATHYYVPGESENHKGEKMPYTEKTSYVQTRINENRLGDQFAALKSGEIAVGDLIEARGQIHNNNYTDKNGISRYGILVDLNKLNVIAKKKAQTEKAEVKVEEPKAKAKAKKETTKAKKATSNKRKL